MSRQLKSIIKNAEKIYFNDKSKFVLMSDCHRGDGTYKDSLLPNTNVYLTALKHYYREDYTYIEVGDGDELWKFNNMKYIYEANEEVYIMLNYFKEENRLKMLYGNHDKDKIKKNFVKRVLKQTYKEHILYKFYKDLPIKECIVLNYEANNKEFVVMHGHQVDFFNNQGAKISKFLVRYIWGFLEGIMGFKDPISPAKSDNKKENIDNKMIKWAKENNKIVIIGHTHKTIFSTDKEVPYFNIGCCVLPNTVTAIEIQGGTICMVKWTIKVSEEGCLLVLREIIAGPERISKY